MLQTIEKSVLEARVSFFKQRCEQAFAEYIELLIAYFINERVCTEPGESSMRAIEGDYVQVAWSAKFRLGVYAVYRACKEKGDLHDSSRTHNISLVRCIQRYVLGRMRLDKSWLQASVLPTDVPRPEPALGGLSTALSLDEVMAYLSDLELEEVLSEQLLQLIMDS